MKAEKTQPGNPHKFVLKQHVFPVASIRRFARTNGRVAVRLLPNGKELLLSPKHEIFTVPRLWDERAESGYMKRIEDSFQSVADRIVNGEMNFTDGDRAAFARFAALWSMRNHFRDNPSEDCKLNGITPTVLDLQSHEVLESNGYIFAREGGVPNRMFTGLQVQIGINQRAASMEGHKWGVLLARDGDFVFPDDFGTLRAIPVTPQIYLAMDNDNHLIPRDAVRQINQLAIAAAKRYLVAKDFAACPL